MNCVISNFSMDTSASCIRAVLRTESKERRSCKRDDNFSTKRNIGKETILNLERIISQEEVEKVADNIKQKRKVNVNDLALLTLSFLQNSDNILIFLKIKGALQSLIRELTGSNSSHQLAAAECLCNLALGNPKSCLQIAKAASPYLITHLQGQNYNLLNTSVLTLGSLAGSDIKSWEVVRSQGLSQKLIPLLTHPITDLVENTLYAIVQFLKVGLHKLDAAELEELANTIIQRLFNNPLPNGCLALYLISCSPLCENILLENNIVKVCFKIIQDYIVDADTVKTITALVRIVANLIPDETGVAVTCVLDNWEQMKIIVNNLLVSGYSHFRSELMWLIGNIINHPSSAVQEFVVNKSDEFTSLFK